MNMIAYEKYSNQSPSFLIYSVDLSEIQMTPRLYRTTTAVRLVPGRVHRGYYPQVLARQHILSLFAEHKACATEGGGAVAEKDSLPVGVLTKATVPK